MLVSVAIFEGSSACYRTSKGRYIGKSLSSKIEKLQLLLVKITPYMGVVRSVISNSGAKCVNTVMVVHLAARMNSPAVFILVFRCDLNHNHSCDLHRIKYMNRGTFSPIVAVIILCFRNSLQPLNRGLHPLGRFM
jgi:hypothetical protein